jgi:hypothetical protein
MTGKQTVVGLLSQIPAPSSFTASVRDHASPPGFAFAFSAFNSGARARLAAPRLCIEIYGEFAPRELTFCR